LALPCGAGGLHPSGFALGRLAHELQQWGTLFLEVAQTKETPAVEQVLGGLVAWMGNDLVDGWLYLPIPLFERLSGLSEDVFCACQSYLDWIRNAPCPAAEARTPHEELIQSVLERVRCLAEEFGREPLEGQK
jgi:hypothetical protein